MSKPELCDGLREFEKWVRELYSDLTIEPNFTKDNLGYVDDDMATRWGAWKAAWNTRSTSPAERKIEEIREVVTSYKNGWLGMSTMLEMCDAIENILEEEK